MHHAVAYRSQASQVPSLVPSQVDVEINCFIRHSIYCNLISRVISLGAWERAE